MKRPVPLKPNFIPPREASFLLALGERLLPLILRERAGIYRVRAEKADLERLRALRDQRFILCANHPGGNDPIIAFWLACQLRRRFNYLAARDIFLGVNRWLLPWAGCYSVIRGMPDRDAIRMTRRLLAEKDRQVVIFPEGEVYTLNDLTLPFQPGVVQMGFWALDDLAKLEKPLTLPVVPVAMKYRCLRYPERQIRAALGRLERALALPPQPGDALYERLLRIGDRVAAHVERELDCEPAPEATLGERIAALKERLLARVAEGLRVPPFSGETYAERLRAGFNAVHVFVSEYAEAEGEYERRLHQRRLEQAAPLFQELWRLYHFIAVSGDYVASQPTCERFLEVVSRLEIEVFGRVRTRVPREAIVRIGEPLELAEEYAAYRAERRPTVARVTGELQRRVVALLEELAQLNTPLPEGVRI